MERIPQKELRNNIGAVLRRAESGEEFEVTVSGRPVAQLGPVPKRRWVSSEVVNKVLAAPTDETWWDDIVDAFPPEELEDPWERHGGK